MKVFKTNSLFQKTLVAQELQLQKFKIKVEIQS